MIERTAEEIAREAIKTVEAAQKWDFDFMGGSVAGAITTMILNLQTKTRNNTLEEIAQIVEVRKGIPEHHSDIAKIIRDLKE